MRRRVKALGWPGGPAQVERQPLTPRVAAWVRLRPEPVGACALDCAESKIPARWSRRSRNSFSTLRHLSRRCWRCDCSTFGRLDWLSEPPGQARLGVDLCGCPPLADNLREIRVRVHLRGSNQRPRELVKERARRSFGGRNSDHANESRTAPSRTPGVCAARFRNDRESTRNTSERSASRSELADLRARTLPPGNQKLAWAAILAR